MKKKGLFSLLLVLALLLGVGAFAHGDARIDYVTDEAGILTAEEQQALRDKAAEISGKYGCGVYVVVVYDHTQYVRGNIGTFAEEVFASYDLGYGDTRDGVLLAMSMKDRDYDLYAHGDFGNYAFTDYGKDELSKTFLDDFRKNDWYSGFIDFIENSGRLIERARNGDPLDQWIPDQPEKKPGLTPGDLLTGLLVGVLFAGGTVTGFKKQMKTAVKQTRAADYVSGGGVQLRSQSDEFVNRAVTRRAVPKQNSGRSGGHYGGTTVSGSHGGSHHSGKF